MTIVRWLLWLMLAFAALPALAQSYMTTVTAQVKDINGTIYNSCQYSATLVNLSTSPLTLGGTALPDQFKQVTGTQCTANGNLSTRLVANTALIPNNSQWQFTICDSNGNNCFNVQTTISGTTLDITALVQSAAVVLPVTNTTLLSGNSNYTGINNFAELHTKQPTVDPLAFAAPGTTPCTDGVGTDDSALFTAAATFILGRTPTPILQLPAKTCRVHGLSWAYGVAIVGQGTGQSQLRHMDGFAEPIIHVTGAANSLESYYGLRGVTLIGGSQTTACVFYDGAIDNQSKWDDVQCALASSPATADGFSVQDYENWHLYRPRWDGVGGYAIKVRGPTHFTFSDLSIYTPTYDNTRGAAGTQSGAGLLFMDTSALLGITKGTIRISDARIEVNRGLTGTAPSRSLIRIVQDAGSCAGLSFPLVNLTLDSMYFVNGATGSDANSPSAKIVSTNACDIALKTTNSGFFGFNEFYNNDAGTAKQAGVPTSSTTAWNVSDHAPGPPLYSAPGVVMTQIGNTNIFTVDSDTNLNNAVICSEGDLIFYKQPRNDVSHKGRAGLYKCVQTTDGFSPVVQQTLAGTGSCTSGSPILTYSTTIGAQLAPGRSVQVTACGAGATVWAGKVLSVDYVGLTATLSTNAGATATGQVVKSGVAQMMASEIITYATAAPTTGTWVAGDVARNTAPTANGIFGWICTAGGTPGTWVAIPTTDVNGKLAFTQIGTSVTGSATLTFTAIAAQTCQEQSFTITGASTTNFGVLASPRASLGNTNLNWSSWVSGTNVVTVRVCNPSVSSITPGAVVWGGSVNQ